MSHSSRLMIRNSRRASRICSGQVGRVAAMLLGIAALASGSSQAATFSSLDQLTQGEFEILMENLAAATHYKSVAPGESLGLLGADVAVELSSTDADADLFARAGGDAADLSETLLVPRVRAHKGLPFGFDIGGFVGALADTDLTIVGVELRYALIDGGVLTPALALRASASRIQGTVDVDMDNAAVELTLSKGFLPFTPYIGAGVVMTRARAREDAGLEDVSLQQEKLFAGINVNLGVNMAAEIDVTGEYVTYSAKLGIRF